jgi:hypothetical protein
MEVLPEQFNQFVEWLKQDGLKPRKSERLWRKTIFARLLNSDKKTIENWEDFMIDQNTKQVEIPILKDFDENCLIGIGVNAQGVHKTIAYVVKGVTMSRIFFEDRSNMDVNNSVIFQILQAYIKAKE